MNEFEIKNGLKIFWFKDLQANNTVKYGLRIKEVDIWTSRLEFLPEHFKKIELYPNELRNVVLLQCSRFLESISNYVSILAQNNGEKFTESQLVN